jgi:hypothetical protein
MDSRTLCVAAAPPRSRSLHDPIYQAFTVLRPALTFAALPFGVANASNLFRPSLLAS